MSRIDTLTDEQIEYARKQLESASIHIHAAQRANLLGFTSQTRGHVTWAEKLVNNALSVFETPHVLRAVAEFEQEQETRVECKGQLSIADLHRVDL